MNNVKMLDNKQCYLIQLFVKLIKKIKIVLLIFCLILIVFGVFFIKSLILNKYPQEKQKIATIKKEQNTTDTILIGDLANCKSELFITKNELERQKIMPDARKDIINLLLTLRDLEKKLGNQSDFSANCISLFSLASRIPIVQEYVLQYKEQMFKTNCNFATNKQIIEMILPFQIKTLEAETMIKKQREKKWYKRFINDVKNKVSQLFVKSKIQKSDLEIAVENYNYNEAIGILRTNNFDKNAEFNELYNAISVLNNIQQMIDGIYDILRTNN